MLRLEIALILIALGLAFIRPGIASDWFERVERKLSIVARRRVLSVVLIGFMALALRIAVLAAEPIPEPIVHDEFGYLLAADTFAHGRLTNPTPPMWEHFETFSILMKPTYQCFAPPGQGMVLALGKILFGDPFWGVWLSCGLMCAAITWMLQGWLAPEWALLGGFLAVLRYAVFGYWADSYWGGALAALGGALVLGTLPRIKQSQRVRDAVFMAIGLALLANTRPYEGFVFSIPVVVVLLAWMFGQGRPSLRVVSTRVLLPLTLLLAVTAAGMGYYFWRVTGSPFRMPYQIEQQTYAVAPYMVWQHVHPEPVYHHAVIRNMYVGQAMLGYNEARNPVMNIVQRSFWAWRFFLGPLLTFPFVVLVFILPFNMSWHDISAHSRFFLIVLAILALAHVVSTFYNPHYSAAETAIIVALVVSAIRRISQWHRGTQNTGLFLARSVVIIAVFMFALRAFAGPLHIPMSEFYEFAWYQKNVPSFGRQAVERQLQQMPGKQIVFVRYDPLHNPFREWVYNEPDIAGSKVIWARDMSPEQNERLLQYFKDRRAWFLEADAARPELQPYKVHLAPELAEKGGNHDIRPQ